MADFRGVGGLGCGEEDCDWDCKEAMSESGALGRRIPPSRGRGGDCELGSRGMGKAVTDGELKDDGGADPDE